MIHLGTSGWQYDDWSPAFYPAALRRPDWLSFYAQRFATVEANRPFYRLPDRRTFSGWAEQTPDDFVMAVKASAYLTHRKKLSDPAEPVQRLLDVASGLGPKLGPVLLQLPPNLHVNAERLADVLTLFAGRVRVAVEVRHGSWLTEPVRDLLTEHGAALCLADRGSRWLTPLWRTAEWGYVRLHAGAGSPSPCYGRSALDRCARDLGRLYGSRRDVFVYFNNDHRCCAARDARRLALALARHGLPAARVPGAREVALA